MIGFKKGLKTPTLPQNIIMLQQNVFIRMFRVLGGLSMILIISKRLDGLRDGPFFIICMSLCVLFTLTFMLYQLYITYHRIKHIIKVYNSDELDVRNSPLDRLASIGVRLI